MSTAAARRSSPHLCATWFVALLVTACGGEENVTPTVHLGAPSGWSEWGRDATHAGHVTFAAQAPKRLLGSAVVDPFVDAEQKETEGDLLIHYQTPLVDGADVFTESKIGRYVACVPAGSGQPSPCGSDGWNDQTWRLAHLSWQNGALIETWSFVSDWKPEPDRGGLGEWEPVFHAVLAGEQLVVPAGGGSVVVVDRHSGQAIRRINPFDDESDARYVAGPLTVDSAGNVVYDAIELAADHPWRRDVVGAWLVKVAPDGTVAKVAFDALVPDAPKAGCRGSFSRDDLPWPPTPDAVPDFVACGSQRPGINVAPAVAPDGTIYTVSRAHFARRYSYLVAVNPDLSPKWAASMRDRLHDGCGTPTMPPTGTPGGCHEGTLVGVDPATNEAPAGIVEDDSTASPTIAPDGTILYGAYTRYNGARGHLFAFSPNGAFKGAYDFGWDVTPAIYEHGGTYSIVIKDNHYGTGSYCSVDQFCPPLPDGPYEITQLAPSLAVEWKFVNTNTESCRRTPDHEVACIDDHPGGFEWCINAPAVDARGVVYANAEDGVLYAIPQGGKDPAQLFLGQSIGAAYTPVSIDASGRIYAQNLGRLFVVGE